MIIDIPHTVTPGVRAPARQVATRRCRFNLGDLFGLACALLVTGALTL